MLYLIGLGLNEKGISVEGKKAIEKCEKIYLENYTVDFPYPIKDLEKVIEKKIIEADREKVENLSIIEEAGKQNVALLVYGSPLFATTHITLLQEAKKKGVKFKVIYNASIFDAIAETGLQLYKFGKITSVPNFEAESFIDVIKDNQKINAHSLVLVDIGLEFEKVVERLEKLIEADKLVVCSRLGTEDSKIYYGTFEELKNKNIKTPFCFIIPGKLHFLEKEVLEKMKE